MSSSGTTTQRTGKTTWKLDPVHSEVEFGVRHMMISTVKGAFKSVQGTVRIDEETYERSEVDVEIDAASIDTRDEKRDQHLRSEDFFHVEEHPTLEFKSRKVEGDEQSFRIPGELTIRGVTRPVILEGELLGGGVDPWGNDRLAFRAETKVSRKDYGLTWNQTLEAGGVLVGDEVTIALEVQVVRADDDQA